MGEGAGTRLDELLFGATDLDRLAVHVDGVDVSWAELIERAEALTGPFAEAGVARGTPVGVMLPNSTELVATLFAVWRVGGVYVPLNPRLGQGDLDHVLHTVEPAVVVTSPASLPRFGERPAVVVDGADVSVLPGEVPARRYDDEVALVQFTSGTTGRPKAVLLEHAGVLSLIDGVLAKLRGGKPPSKGGSKPPMPNLVPVSLSLWAGLYNVLFAFRTGAPVVVMDGFDPVEFAGLVRRFGIRSTVLPPAAMTTLVDDERIEGLAPLRFVRSITAPLSPLQARRFRDRFGISVLNSYGQTEIGGEIVGWSAADSREFGDDKLGSVGRPHEGVAIRVVDTDAHEAAEGDVRDGPGEIWVRTPAMSAGYADGTGLGDRLSEDGWFRTGDVGHVDADGFLWIEGRVSDMINRGGFKVFPSEVEEVLRLGPGVTDVAVVGVPDARLGEVPAAFLVVDGERAVDELEALCRQHLAPYKVPVAFHVVDELPRNEVGKVRKADLAALAAP